MPHHIEETGTNLLIEHLRRAGHDAHRLPSKSLNNPSLGVGRLRAKKTFDIEVDGQYAEVKTKNKSFKNLDFISITDKQHEAAQTRDFDVYIVCGVEESATEFYKVRAHTLLAKKARVVVCYEYDKNLLKDIVELI